MILKIKTGHPFFSGIPVVLLRVIMVLFLFLFSERNHAGEELILEGETDSETFTILNQYCADCHNHTKAKGKINLEGLLEDFSVGRDFKTWALVVQMLKENEMPPEDEPQPGKELRSRLVQLIQAELNRSKAASAGDPGPVVLRRLTSAEYNYAIQDLTGLDLKLDRIISSDAVGGEGFTNVGDVQFVQDATIERYLDAAGTVASHALIASGSLAFSSNPGITGQELDAIDRILSIYRQFGFRSGAGEGAEAFGLEQYPKAFYVAWLYRNRDAIRQNSTSLNELSEQEGVNPRFAEHIWTLFNQRSLSYPLSEIVNEWLALPRPESQSDSWQDTARKGCQKLFIRMSEWQSGLAANTDDDEEAAIMDSLHFKPRLQHEFRVGISWPEGSNEAIFDLSMVPSCLDGSDPALVLWDRPRLAIRQSGSAGRRSRKTVPLKDLMSKEQVAELKFGEHPDELSIDSDSFITEGLLTIPIRINVPSESRGGVLLVTVRMDPDYGRDCLVRCTVSDGLVEGETVASTGASAALLANPDSPQLITWRKGIADFARNLPQVSHREPAPSDRDPIPPPFDNTYNNAERNRFHYVIKYHRDDRFLYEYMLDDSERRLLDEAWTDLLTSFDYHQTYIDFVAGKNGLENFDVNVSGLGNEALDSLPQEARTHIEHHWKDWTQKQTELIGAESGHLKDVMLFTERAWRRPITEEEESRLREFYRSLRRNSNLSHREAVRGLLTRVLVSPGFLYRFESIPHEPGIVDISDSELAGRLSFFLWSSIPDASLLRLAGSQTLRDPETLKSEVFRMLRDPRSRRFAREFFGQWLGFYQFDQYRGIDTERFPEFTDQLKFSLYDEAVSFFEYIVRNDRPIGELIDADYTFLNQGLARHYGIQVNGLKSQSLKHLESVESYHRGGLLQLGAILTATSAPLRTSPVKRGDWVLRRILGTPVPPPPADAGSIPADDILSDGLTVRERLEAHRRNPDCVNCHARIDPLGFALEHFDPIGRWREHYRDGQTIDVSGVLSDGSAIKGIDGLKQYLDANRDVFHRNLVAKLLGYASGRTTMVSDQNLIETLTGNLTPESRFSDLILGIVSSPQFLMKRGNSELSDELAIETSEIID